MTLTAVASVPTGIDPLPQPTPPEVVELQAFRGYPAVSVLMTTDPAVRMTPTDAARLDSLVMDASRRLRAEFPRGVSEPLCRQLRDLAADAEGRPTRSGVALYVGPGGRSSSWALPLPVLDRTVVDPTFATRDLVRALHRTPRHVVLVLTDAEARLFDGSGDTLLPALSSAFPLRRDGGGRSHRGRPMRSSPRGPGVRASGGTDEDQEAFLRTVDRALGTYLRLHPAPLVVIGTQRTASRFVHLSRNTGRLAGVVHGSHARTPLPVLAGMARPVLDRYLRSRQDEALALLDRQTGRGRAFTGMPSVWLAARTQRPEMLVVDQEFFYPARLSPDGDLLTPATDVEHPDVLDDAVDEVIETVLVRGGWIALVEAGALDHCDRIALTVRNP